VSFSVIPAAMDLGEPAAKRQRQASREVPVTDDTWYLKLAVSDEVASGIIGKGGQTIRGLIADTGGLVRLSSPGQYLPGTKLRAMVVAGALEVLPVLIGTVVEKQVDIMTAAGNDKALTLKLVCAKSAVSFVMGPGGQTAKELVAATGAKFSASDSDSYERTLTLFGDPEAISFLALQIAQRINLDPNFRALATQLDYGATAPAAGQQAGMVPRAPRPAAQRPMAQAVGGPMGLGQPARPPAQVWAPGVQWTPSPQAWAGSRPPAAAPLLGAGSSQDQTTLFTDIPQELMGGLIGKGGSTIKSLCQMSGAKISVMKEGNVLPGISAPHRTVRMSGSFGAVQKAHQLVQQTLSQTVNSAMAHQGAMAHGAEYTVQGY